MESFVNRLDIYELQYPNGKCHEYRTVREELTQILIWHQLARELTVGPYARTGD